MIGRSKAPKPRRRSSYNRGPSKTGRHSAWSGARRRRRRWFVGAVLLLVLLASVVYALGTLGSEGSLSELFGEGSSSGEDASAGSAAAGPTPEQLGASPAAAAYGIVAPELPGIGLQSIQAVRRSVLDPSWASVDIEAPAGDEGTYVVFLRRDGGLWKAQRSIRADEPDNPDYENVVLNEAEVPKDLIDSVYPENLSVDASKLLSESLDLDSLPSVEKAKVKSPVLDTKDVPKSERGQVDGGLEKARQTIEDYGSEFEGTAGVYVQDLNGGWGYGANPDEIFFGASVIKVPVMVAVFRKIDEGELSLSDSFKTESGDWAGGAGWMQWDKAGKSHTVQDYLSMMMTQSDNVAANALVRLVGGREYVNQVASSMGARNTTLVQKITSERAAVTALDNQTTPRDMSAILKKIAAGTAASPDSCEEMMNIMSQNHLQSSLKDGIPKGVGAANKGGWLYKVYNDVGFVWDEDHPYAAAIFSKHGSGDVEDGKSLMKNLSEAAWQAQGGSKKSSSSTESSAAPEASGEPPAQEPAAGSDTFDPAASS